MLLSCKNKGFYEYSKIGDVYRIPLLEPYEANSYSYGTSWFFELPFNNMKYKSQVADIKLIGVEGSHIVVYTERTSLPQGMSEAWFVIDLDGKTEKFFTTEASYKEEIEKEGIETIILYNVKEVFKEFDEEKKLPLEWVKNRSLEQNE
jgi:hypothetical protein